MKNVVINNIVYHLQDEWKEITLAQVMAIDLVEVPKKMEDIIKATNEKKRQEVIDKVTEDDICVTFANYYREVIYLLSDIPIEVLNRVDYESITNIFNTYLGGIIGDIISFNCQTHQQTDRKSFKIKGIEYYLPETVIIAGQSKPLERENVGTFCEAYDLFQVGWQYMPYFIAVLCREKGKEYNEDEALSRFEDIKTLRMDVVMDVFFYFVVCLNMLRQTLNGYMTGVDSRKRQEMLISGQDLSSSDSSATYMRLQNQESMELQTMLN